MSDAISSQPIQLPGAPTTSLQSATKGYVDSNTADKVSRNGDTMLAPLFLAMSGSPTSTEAVSKSWVDGRIATGAGGALTAANVVSSATGNVSSTNVQAAIAELDTEKVNKSGDTMTGYLTLNADPTLSMHAATKQYVDQYGTTTISQPSSLSTWDIVHMLNRYPDVITRNSAGDVVMGALEYVNANEIKIYFTSSFSGTVYLN